MTLTFDVSGPLSYRKMTLFSTYRMLAHLPQGWAQTWPPIRPLDMPTLQSLVCNYYELRICHLCVSLVQVTGWRTCWTEAHRGWRDRLCFAAFLHLMFTELTQHCSPWATELANHLLLVGAPFKFILFQFINMPTTSHYTNVPAPADSLKQKVETKYGSLLSIPYCFRKVAACGLSSFSLANTQWFQDISNGPLQHNKYAPARCCKELPKKIVLSDGVNC